jgi:hypothetical protein
MKRILFVIALITFSSPAVFSQRIISFWGGAGLSNNYNFDVAPEGGIDVTFGLANHLGFGLSAFYKNYSFYYDKEVTSTSYGTGDAGYTLRNLSNYIIAAPKLDYAFSRHNNLHFYVKGGPGFLLGGTETLHTWQNSYTAPPFNASFNDTISTSKNIKSMVMYLGFGFTEYSFASKHVRFTLTEDFGFLTSSLTKTTDVNSTYHSVYGPQNFNPMYISIQLGIALKYPEDPLFIKEY